MSKNQDETTNLLNKINNMSDEEVADYNRILARKLAKKMLIHTAIVVGSIVAVNIAVRALTKEYDTTSPE